jgi:N-acetyl-alpha-D-muramate 1-phosphate uridylyltransferase
MRAIILAAGRGARMRPLTDATPKPLLKVAGKCLIDYHLEKLARAGFRNVVINVSWLAEQIVAHVGDGAQFGLHIHWSYEPVALETGGGIATALDHLGTGAFALVSADVFTDFDFAEFARLASGLDDKIGGKLLLVPRQTTMIGEYLLHNDQLARAGKDDPIDSTYTWASLGVFHTSMFAAMPKYQPFTLMPHYIEWMAVGKMQGEVYRGIWDNLGTPEQLRALNTKMVNYVQSQP